MPTGNTPVRGLFLLLNQYVAPLTGLFLILFCCMISGVLLSSVSAQDISTGQTIRIVATDYPPHVIAAEEGGMDLDILRGVLDEMGHPSTVSFVPTKRALAMVTRGDADVAVPVFLETDRDGYYTSDAIIEYKPTVFTLSKNQDKFRNLGALSEHRVVTFIGASGYFGTVFTNATDKAISYNEINNVDAMPELLLMERYSAAVLDANIFYYFYRKENKNRDLSVFDAHAVFPKVEASVGFNNKSFRDSFNQHLAKYRAAGKDHQVIEKYIGATR
ncbi:substrate-binding periplasmic protein [Kiloniella litopenaei]|uniref:substrate-binding periplasmic protein n=1 Tax=Kiloniella litopenaei TaxID=1549748 RepID=UPI0012FF4D24|nr:transporter substrate-binding domain-containing protein [Kiloniella litopenaei]